MNIRIVTPAPARSLKGNRVTALRWKRLLCGLGHRVTIQQQYDGGACDVLVALHARRSRRSIELCRRLRPKLPVLLALTGTDLYADIHKSKQARQAMASATRLILLQPDGLRELPRWLRDKARVILQSATPPANMPAPLSRWFEVSVVGHLRPVKDPFRAAMAAARLPESSRIRVFHLGAALGESMHRRAVEYSARDNRYRWLGELSRAKTIQRIARSRLLLLTSKLEGGANVICEALVAGTPVVSSRISGSIGMLGADYPGYFPVGDTAALTKLLSRAETDAAFYSQLESICRRLAPMFTPRRETRSWRELLDELPTTCSVEKL